MKERKIVITVDHETGDSTVEGVGFEGTMCDSVLSKFISGKVVSDTKKPEYRAKATGALTAGKK